MQKNIHLAISVERKFKKFIGIGSYDLHTLRPLK